jgi:hypothetical protein
MISTVEVPLLNNRVETSARSKSEKMLHNWVIFVVVKYPLVQTGQIDGPTEYLSQVLAVVGSRQR